MKMLNNIKKFFRSCTNEITLVEAQNMINDNNNIILLDVRSPQEFEEGHLDGAISIPLYELKYKANKLLPNKESVIIAYCLYGVRSKKATKILQKLNYKNVYSIKDGVTFL